MSSSFFSAYGETSLQHLDGRELEAAVLRKAAGKLSACESDWSSVESGVARDLLDAALAYNQRLWTVLQSDLTSSASTLPDELRASLLQISRYVDRLTFSAIARPELNQIQQLVRINLELAAGLSEGAGAGTASADYDSSTSLSGFDYSF
jgi:flagellar protein FlaF